MSPDISIDDIPDSVLEDVRLEIQHYLVPLLVGSRDNLEHPVDLAGSGTLVELASRHYILTADHVWNRVEVQDWEELGLMLTDGAPLGIERSLIAAKRLRAGSYSRWGPDLALLEIPPNLVGTIMARKSFLNLARRRSMLPSHPPQTEKSLWAVMGLVGQKSTVEPVDEKRTVIARVRGEAFFGVTCTAERRGEYDYLTVYAKTTLREVPSSFGGISGGGLWEVTLKMRGDSIISRGEHHFRGVAFWEEREAPDRIAIRCHGPHSIFHTAWAEWALQE
jgi:hypothetical protein